MRASLIIRSCNEAERLRLTLASLQRQTEAAEIIVVNDGSTDHTSAVIEAAAAELALDVVTHARPQGRAAAANAGAAAACGEILIFLDGDTLAGPELVAAHLRLHREAEGGAGGAVGRGETYHLRGTRFFQDPETGAPQPGQEERVARLSRAERARLCVTRAEVLNAFHAVEARAQPGIYPGAGPRDLYEIEMAALRTAPDCPVLWAAASGSNQSVPRAAFLEVGGFNPHLTINEHRELALRLCNLGLRMRPVEARSYHLTHRSGWRDPLLEPDWEPVFYSAHPIAEVALLSIFWASRSATPPFADAARIDTLPDLARAAERCRDVTGGPEAVRARHRRVALAPDEAAP